MQTFELPALRMQKLMTPGVQQHCLERVLWLQAYLMRQLDQMLQCALASPTLAVSQLQQAVEQQLLVQDLLAEQVQNDGQAAVSAWQACFCYCHQTRTLPAVPCGSAHGALQLLRRVCAYLQLL